MALVTIIGPSTLEQKQAATAAKIRGQIGQAFNTLKITGNAITDAIFYNEFKITPQEVCDALGADAGALVSVSQAVAAILNGIIPDTMNLALPFDSQGRQQTLTVNQDGTVAIGVIEPSP